MLLHSVQNKQSSAGFHRNSLCVLAKPVRACKPIQTEYSSDHLALHDDRCGTHFDTPFPYGLLVPLGVMLPNFFGQNLMNWPELAKRLQRSLSRFCCEANLPTFRLSSKTGSKKCHTRNQANSSLNHAPSWRSVRHLPDAVTRSPIKRCLVVLRARAWRLSRAGVCSLGPPLGQAQTYFIAKPTPGNATKSYGAFAQRSFRNSLSDVKVRQLMLLFSQWALKAQPRGIYYETYYLHFCSNRTIFDQRVFETRRAIESWRDVAFGSTSNQISWPCRKAQFDEYMALTVPHQWGGFSRFCDLTRRILIQPHSIRQNPTQLNPTQLNPTQLNPIKPNPIKKDITCSTRS